MHYIQLNLPEWKKIYFVGIKNFVWLHEGNQIKLLKLCTRFEFFYLLARRLGRRFFFERISHSFVSQLFWQSTFVFGVIIHHTPTQNVFTGNQHPVFISQKRCLCEAEEDCHFGNVAVSAYRCVAIGDECRFICTIDRIFPYHSYIFCHRSTVRPLRPVPVSSPEYMNIIAAES